MFEWCRRGGRAFALCALPLAVGCGGGDGGVEAASTARWNVSRSCAVAVSSAGTRVVSVNPDDDSVTVFDVAGGASAPLGTVSVGDTPWSVAIDARDARAYVANAGGDTVSVVDVAALAVVATVPGVPTPQGVALTPNDGFLYATTGAEGKVLKIRVSDLSVRQVIPLPGATAPWAVCVTNDGDADDDDESVFVTDFFSQPRPGMSSEASDVGRQGVVYRIDANGAAADVVVGTILLLPSDTGFTASRTSFCTEKGAVNDTYCGDAFEPVFAFPNLLASVEARGSRLYVPSFGVAAAPPVRFDSNGFALLSVVDGTSNTVLQQVSLNRTVEDEADVPADPLNGVFLSTLWDLRLGAGGTQAHALSAGSDVAVRLQVAEDGTVRPAVGAGGIVRIAVGKNPRGIAIDPAGARAYVMNYVSRDVSVIDVAVDAVVATMPSSPLPGPGTPEAQVHLGKELFNASRGPAAADPAFPGRFAMSDNGWGSCFNCHPFGLSDGVTWSFSSGPRQSTSLDGTFAKGDPTDQRILNWSAVRSSVQDFEKNTENVSGGFGLIGPNGAGDGVVDHGANRGLDPRADAIEEYVKTIRTPRAPSDVSAGPAALGRAHFQALGCAGCHGGPKWTVSRVTYALPASAPDVLLDDGQVVEVGGQPVLRDVGSFDPTGPLEIRGAGPQAGQVAHGALGFNPPSLLGVHASPPYFHDGRFRTLAEVVDSGHGLGGAPVTPAQRAELVEFLRSIDETSPVFDIP